MEDKKEMNSCTNSCGVHCGGKSCGDKKDRCCGGGYMYHILKKVLKLVIILIIFCFGVQLGTLKGELRAMYRYSGMTQNYGEKFDGFRMMKNWPSPTVSGTIVIPTPTVQ